MEFGSLTDQRPTGTHVITPFIAKLAPGAFDDFRAEVVALKSNAHSGKKPPFCTPNITARPLSRSVIALPDTTPTLPHCGTTRAAVPPPPLSLFWNGCASTRAGSSLRVGPITRRRFPARCALLHPMPVSMNCAATMRPCNPCFFRRPRTSAPSLSLCARPKMRSTGGGDDVGFTRFT